MLSGRDSIFGQRLQDPFIAAVPDSLILREAFDLMINFIMDGDLPYNSDFNFILKN